MPISRGAPHSAAEMENNLIKTGEKGRAEGEKQGRVSEPRGERERGKMEVKVKSHGRRSTRLNDGDSVEEGKGEERMVEVQREGNE